MPVPDFKPSAQLYPFESRWFETSCGRLHYVDEGSGRPILLLHGNPTWSFLYRNVIARLRDRFRCVAVDYLGFGLSERPSGFAYTPRQHVEVVSQLVRHLDLSGLVVAGHDWGGPIGLGVAALDPERVEGLVLGNTWFWPPTLGARLFSRVMSSHWMQRRIREENYFVDRLLPGGIVRKLSDEEMAHYRGVQSTADLRVGVAEFPRQIVAAASWLADLQRSVTRDLATKRVLVTYPMRDLGFRAGKILPRFRATFRDIEVVELRHAKHFFLEDESDVIAASIAARFR